MSGVLKFNDKGTVIHFNKNPRANQHNDGRQGTSTRRKVLVHLPTGEVVSSYASLEQILGGLGWERYSGPASDPNLLQFHKQSSIDLISLPRDFSRFSSIHMFDMVVKNPNVFHVRDM